MIKFITILCLALLSFKAFCEDSCPLDSVKSSQNLTPMIGRWYEYKKTTDFLADNMCTTYEVTCPNNSTCNVNLISNGTNTGYANILVVNGSSTVWGYNTIYLNVNSTQQFAILWTCKSDDTDDTDSDDIKEYQLVALVRDLSNEDTINEIDTLLNNITVKYWSELEIINNTLCSGAKKSTMHATTILLVLIFSVLQIQAINS